MKSIKYKKILLLLIIVCLFIFIKYNFLYITVFSSSMNPTLDVGDKIITIDKHICDINIDDIIVFENHDTNINTNYLIKRVVAKEYDYVEIINNKLFINHKFIKDIGTINSPKISLLLKENEFFVLGDNINNSYDSRNYGPISYEQILGKKFF